VKGAVTRKKDTVKDTVTKKEDDLRASAIAPLPLPSFGPAALRQLEWSGADEDEALTPASARVLAAKTIRRLSRDRLEPSERNDLGCAYAVLAWVEGCDGHWLLAIEELRAAESAGEDIAKTARSNLDAIRSGPAAMRQLKWSGAARVLAAKTIRRLPRDQLEPSERNDLGCAYAVLAWVE
jgi:hypothetical protein